MKAGRKSVSSGQEGGDKDNGRTPGSDPGAPAAGQRAPVMAKANASGKGVKRGFLDGQMLIAMPSMGDERFARAVIYMCAHSADGAMGI
ncbi:MAG TPA: YqgE/AlgH family protein, partial [Xanthobacteraceae bacterium]